VLDHSLPIGSGYAYRTRSILTFQQRLGLEPVALTSPKQGDASDDGARIDGILHFRTPPVGDRTPFLRELRLMWRLAARILAVARAQRVEVIHAHSPLLNGLPALWAARRLGVRVVYEIRTFWEDAAVSNGTFAEGSIPYRVSRALETVVVRRADRVVAICDGIRREVLRRGVPARRVAVIPNGVDSEQFQPVPRARHVAERLGLGEGPVFGYIGSFSHYEGLPFLVDASRALRRAIPEARILLVGGGRDEPAIQAAAREAGAGVTVVGRVPQEQVRELYGVLDVFVLPRRRIRLTELVTPLKPLEAMAMGTPVLASDVGGHVELIRDGETGCLFAAEDREALVAQATRLGQSVDLRAALAEKGREHVATHRSWKQIVAGYLPVYRET